MRVIAGGIALLAATLFLAHSAFSADSGSEVAVVGVDENQVPIVKMIPLSDYTDILQSGMSAVQDSILPVLQKQEQNSTPAKALKLQTVGVGFSLSGQFGIGPIWSVTVTPRFRLIFTNSKKPVYPVYN